MFLATPILKANHNPEVFSNICLNQWHSNEKIFNILHSFDKMRDDSSCSSKNWLTNEVIQRPKNGSVFLFDRRIVKGFKKDYFLWKRRKTGGAKSVREDRMCLKVNGVDSIYASYSHSTLIGTFHRRCYWLLNMPDIVLVHYLQIPNSDSSEFLINLNSSIFGDDIKLTIEDLEKELFSMLWPYCLDETFIQDNLKLNSLTMPINTVSQSVDFMNLISSHLFDALAKKCQTASIRISMNSFQNKQTNLILSSLNLTNLMVSYEIYDFNGSIVRIPIKSQNTLLEDVHAKNHNYDSNNSQKSQKDNATISAISENNKIMNKIILSIESCSVEVSIEITLKRS